MLHAHLPYTAAFGRLVALTVPGPRRPVLVYTEHSLWNKAAVRDQGAQPRRPSGVDQALIVVSVAARDALPRALRSRARVVVHGVDRARFAVLARASATPLRRDVRAELGIADDEVLALTVANLRSEKGYDVLLEAARLSRGGGRAGAIRVGRARARSRPSWRPRREAAGLDGALRLPGHAHRHAPASWPAPTSSSCRRTKRGSPSHSWRR